MADVRAKVASSLVWSDTTAWQYWDGVNWVDYLSVPLIGDNVWLNGQSVITNATTSVINFSRLMQPITGTSNVPPGTGTNAGGTLTIGVLPAGGLTVTSNINNGIIATAAVLIISVSSRSIAFVDVPVTSTASTGTTVSITGTSNTITWTRTAGTETTIFPINTSAGVTITMSAGSNNLTIGSSGNLINISAGGAIGLSNTGTSNTLLVYGNVAGSSTASVAGINSTQIFTSLTVNGNVSAGTSGAGSNGIVNSNTGTHPSVSINGNITASGVAHAINFNGANNTITTLTLAGILTASGAFAAFYNGNLTGTISTLNLNAGTYNASTGQVVIGGFSTITSINMTSCTFNGANTKSVIATNANPCAVIADGCTFNPTDTPIFVAGGTGAGTSITLKNTCVLNNGSSTASVTPLVVASGRFIASNGTTFKYNNSNVPAAGADPLIFTPSGTTPPLSKYVLAGTGDGTGTLTLPQPANVLSGVNYGVGQAVSTAEQSTGTLDIPNAVAQVVGNIVANLT